MGLIGLLGIKVETGITQIRIGLEGYRQEQEKSEEIPKYQKILREYQQRALISILKKYLNDSPFYNLWH